MVNLNWVDYVILAIFFFSMLAGFFRGFVREIISLATLIAAFVIATLFSNKLAILFTNSEAVQGAVNQTSSVAGLSTATSASYVAIGISFALLFIGTMLVGAILGYFINAIFQSGILGFGNRVFGGIFGFIRGYLLIIVLLFVVQLTPFGEEDWYKQSKLVPIFQSTIVWLTHIVSPSLESLKDKFGTTLEGATSQLQNIGQ